MPVLPLVDLLILMAWTCLIIAFGEKAVALAMANPRFILFGMTSYDWVITAGVCLLFALALAARVWVKATEPGLLRLRRERNGNGRGIEVLPDFPDPREEARLAAARAAAEADDEVEEREPTRIAAR